MHLHDKLTIDATRRTAAGYLAVSARVARGGNVQLYSGAELGKPEMATVRVYRPADEVFSTDTMKSFAHLPVTLGHPPGEVTADNWRQFAKGWAGDEVARDGDTIRVPMLLADVEAIRAVEAGTRELSMGYDCAIQWGAGVSPSGEAYDAKQMNVRGNHVALVHKARGGADLRIGDSAMPHMTDQEAADAAYQRSADHNSWRDGARPQPSAPTGRFAPVHPSQRVSDEDLQAAQAKADAALHKGLDDMNSWRNA